MKTCEKVKFLIHYYDSNRMVGHTTKTIDGADDGTIVIVNNMHMAKRIKELFPTKRLTFVSLNNLDILRGCHSPIVFDNAAIYSLLHEIRDNVKEWED